MRLHAEGVKFLIVTSVVIAACLFLYPWLAIIPGAFLILVLIFFRNPTRISPNEQGVIVAPADGRLIEVVENELPPIPAVPDNGDRYTRISIFLSLLNVHVTRAAFTGVIGRILYKPGKFFHAATRRGIEQNETNSIEIISDLGRIFVVQSTGALARRIICSVATGKSVTLGQEIGFIRFGSRVDLYVPTGLEVDVDPARAIVGGVTVLCRAPSPADTDKGGTVG
jgi:phosphatidylserine decarboxylase